MQRGEISCDGICRISQKALWYPVREHLATYECRNEIGKVYQMKERRLVDELLTRDEKCNR